MASRKFGHVTYLVLASTLIASILIATASACAKTPRHDFQSCDPKRQQALGAGVRDPLQAHIATRSDILQADIGHARRARHITQVQADELRRRIGEVRTQADGFVAEQGFLSAAERASFDRELDEIASEICR